MKKMLCLLILSSVSLLHADYYNQGGLSNQDHYNSESQGQYQQNPGQYQQGNQSQYQQPGQYQQPQYQQPQYQQPGQYQQGSQFQSNNGSSNLSQIDQRLTQQIQDMLRNNNNYRNVSVNVTNGYVTLTGTVQSQNDRNFLEQKLHGFSGVQGVDNQLNVQK